MINSIELQAQQLFIAWTRHFRQQDMTLKYTQVETARTLFIPESNVLLVGIIDAEGEDFFSEYKTANPRGAKTWKREWLLSTQALTYGLLTGGSKRFLVRKVFKAAQPFCDHEWFQFTPHDLANWRRQVDFTAQEIYGYTGIGLRSPWPQNLTHGCFAYGANYPCPFWEHGCTKHNYDGSIPGAGVFVDFPEFEGHNRVTLMNAINEHPNALLLSKTRIESWHRCRELYRRNLTMSFPPSEAMQIGSHFHALVGDYTSKLISARANKIVNNPTREK